MKSFLLSTRDANKRIKYAQRLHRGLEYPLVMQTELQIILVALQHPLQLSPESSGEVWHPAFIRVHFFRYAGGRLTWGIQPV